MSRALLLLFLAAITVGGMAGIHAHRLLERLGGANGAPSLAEVMETPFGGKRKVFLLVLGVDEKNRLRRTDNRRSDTMILAALDLEGKRVAALSLPRDTRAHIPGREGYDKLNAAHNYGGVPLVRQAVEELLGIPIDRYVKTDVNGFRAIVDLIGPIELDVEKRMDYDDNWGNLHIHLKPGRQLLDGEKAEGYVRFRHDATGDLGRMKRQQKFLRAVAAEMLKLHNLSRLPQVVEQGMQYIETDLSPRELYTVAMLFRDVPLSQIATATLPGQARYLDRVSYFVPDEEETARLLQKLFFSTQQAPRASVVVLNGNGLPGIAREAAKRLATAGFHVSRTGNAANYDFELTEITVSPGQEPDARRAATLLGVEGARIRVLPATEAVSEGLPAHAEPMSVVLGKDYRP
jgi:LCP family protein required for cell wall assembly